MAQIIIEYEEYLELLEARRRADSIEEIVVERGSYIDPTRLGSIRRWRVSESKLRELLEVPRELDEIEIVE